MKPLREILFPTDFSQAGAAMVPYAREMAERFDARVTVLNAFDLCPSYAMPPHFVSGWDTQGGSVPYTPELQTCRQEFQRRLEQFAGNQFASVRHAARIEDGDPATVIEWIARLESSDIIIMPTTGRLGRFRRLLLGSVTTKVLHDIACPVLTSAHQLHPDWAATPGFHSILCAVEMNPEAEDILDAAAFLAQAYQARLCLVHMESTSSRPNALQGTAESFQQALNHYANAGVQATIRVLDTSVPEGIRRTAIEEKADLIVVGRGHLTKGLSRLWSSLYTIICESPCPVLSV
jgi:nucleotide-binding universal stress UspA family protein